MRKSAPIAVLVVVILFVYPAQALAAPSAAPGLQETSGVLGDIGQALGVLGLFAAIMAVLALGTEVIIDSIKLAIGLKKKPTAAGAMEEWSKLLPGELEALGLEGDAIQRISDLAAATRSVVLPVQRVAIITDEVRQGNFAPMFDALDTWLANPDNATVQQLRNNFTIAVTNAGKSFLDRLEITGETRTNFDQQLAEVLEDISLADSVEKILALFYENVPEIVEAWLNGQAARLAQEGLERGRGVILESFDEKVVPLLRQLGLEQPAVDAIRRQVEEALNSVSGQLQLDALHALLRRVEQRRFEIQSPLRKLWRWLRRVEFPGAWIARARNLSGAEAARARRFSVGSLFMGLETLYNRLVGRTPPPGYTVDDPRPVPPLSPRQLASQIFELENYHIDEEKTRQRLMRLVSIIAGIILAYILQIDSIAILSDAFPVLNRVNEVVNTAVVSGWLNPQWLENLIGRPIFTVGAQMELNAGILLSGLAASAGSSYWHERLGQIRVAKQTVATVSDAVESLRRTAGTR